MYMCKISCRIYVFRGADALVCKNCITRVCVRESLGWRAPIALFQIVNGLKYEICCVVIWIVVFFKCFWIFVWSDGRLRDGDLDLLLGKLGFGDGE